MVKLVFFMVVLARQGGGVFGEGSQPVGVGLVKNWMVVLLVNGRGVLVVCLVVVRGNLLLVLLVVGGGFSCSARRRRATEKANFRSYALFTGRGCKVPIMIKQR